MFHEKYLVLKKVAAAVQSYTARVVHSNKDRIAIAAIESYAHDLLRESQRAASE
jgi:hypothetical protein